MSAHDSLDSESQDPRLDAALRSYAEPPFFPDARFAAARILKQGRELEACRRRLWIWAMAVPATACVILIAAVAISSLLRAPLSLQIAWIPSAPGIVKAPQPAIQPSNTVTPQRRTDRMIRVSAAQPRPLPKLDVFPTPEPLSPEEQALVDFAKHGPPGVQRAVVEDQKHWDDPIIVADLQNQPPQSGSQQDR